VDIPENLAHSSLCSEDLAPIPLNKRTWGTWNYAALWISMSLCIPTYMLASSLIEGGMNWWQSILTMLRAIIACGWFGIQTWIGGFAVYQMMRLWIPAIDTLPQIFPAPWSLQTGP